MNGLTRPLPWYRHLWPWLLMIAPAGAVIGGAITIWLAVRTNDGLVTDDYYKQGLTINQTTARDQQAASLGLEADAMLGADRQDLRLTLRAKPGFTPPETLTLRLAHPTRAGVDQILPVQRESAGAGVSGSVYRGRLAQRAAGRWRVVLEDAQQAWRLTGEWTMDKTPLLHMP